MLDKKTVQIPPPQKEKKMGEKFFILSQNKEIYVLLISRDGTDLKRFTIAQNSKITIFFVRYFFTFLTLKFKPVKKSCYK